MNSNYNFIKKLMTTYFLMLSFFSFSQTVFEETFSAATLPAGWTIQSTSPLYYSWKLNTWTAEMEITQLNVAQSDWLITPTINLSNVSDAYLNFSMTLYGPEQYITKNSANMKVKISKDNGVTWTELWNDDQIPITNFQDGYLAGRNFPKSLKQFCGTGMNNIKIGFQYTSNGTDVGSFGYLRDVKISTECPIPALGNITSTNLDWLPIENFSGTYDIEYGYEGFTQGTGTLVTGITGNSFTFPLFMCRYDVYIRANCGSSLGKWSDSNHNVFKFNNIVSIPNSTSNTVYWENTFNKYRVMYGTRGVWSGNAQFLENVSGNTFVIPNLQPCTDYQFYIIGSCGGEDWVSSVQDFSTSSSGEMVPLTPYYIEKFDQPLCQLGYTNVSGNNISGATVNNTLTMLCERNKANLVYTRNYNLTAGVPVTISYKVKNYSTALFANGSLQVKDQKTGFTYIVEQYVEPTQDGNYTNFTNTYIPTNSGKHSFYFYLPELSLSSFNMVGSGFVIDDFSVSFPVISMVGTNIGTAWNTDVDLSTTDGVNYIIPSYTFSTPGSVKFRESHTDTRQWSSASFPTGIGNNNNTAIPVPAGKYSIKFNRSTGQYTFGAALATVAESVHQIFISPNPVSDILTIRDSEKYDKAEIYDASGRKIAEIRISNNKIDVKTLKNGTYILKVHSNKKDQVFKFIKN